MKANSPLLGFNNNVKHKGRVFHVQTEDSGVKHPHVITHLFVDGGRILKSIKTSYAEFLEDEDLKQKVRLLMQEQHKAMFIALRAGKFDPMVEGGTDVPPPPASSEAAAKPPESGGTPASKLLGKDASPDPTAEPAAALPAGDPSSKAAQVAPEARPPDAPAASPSTVAGAAAPPEGQRPPSSEGRAPPSATRQPAAAPGARPATQPPTSGSPVSLRPSLMPPPPRASLSSVSSERASVTNERASFTNERASGVGSTGSGDRPAIPNERPSSPRSADPRAETLSALPVEPHRPRLASPLELNLEALERSTPDPRPSSFGDGDVRDLPPPPAAVLGRRPSTINTSYRSIQHTDPRAEQSAPEDRASRPPPASRGTVGDAPPTSVRNPPPSGPTSRPRTMSTPQPQPQPAQQSVRPPRSIPPPRSLTPQGARYAASRPASIFGSARPQEGSSIFGEDLISEKSLDEVILSYLAEDLEGGKPKR